MTIKLILPALIESGQPGWRPLKYSLFPPLTLATLAAWIPEGVDIRLCDEHVEGIDTDDRPDLVILQVYTSSARRAYQLADHYRLKGCHVVLGGLHVTALPEEAALHADTLILGPADQSFPAFIADWMEGRPKKSYTSSCRDIGNIPMPRRDLYRTNKYFVPSTLVVSRGCPHRCSFCYVSGMYKGGRSYYRYSIDRALEEIERLPGRYVYFLDDNLFADESFAIELMEAMRGMGKVFQAASTLKGLSNPVLLKKAADAGLKSIFTGFETLGPENLRLADKSHNELNYERIIADIHQQGVLINGSFVFGLDADTPDVFSSTTEWAINQGITTATFHIATPFPGTRYFQELKSSGRLLHTNWDLYDTRHSVFRPARMSPEQLEQGYRNAYRDFYSWNGILESAFRHADHALKLKHLLYSAAWKKMEIPWRLLIQAGLLPYARRALDIGLSIRGAHTPAETPFNEPDSPSIALLP